MTNEIAIIKKDVDEFLIKNQENFEIMAQFQDQIVNLTQENFPETIKLVKDHKNIFFKDHGTTFTFIYYIVRATLFNFKKLELVLDICINFRDEIRSALTDYEILTVFSAYQISISYLYTKQFFPIESIFKVSNCNNEIFINFLPEIEEYDQEYAKIKLNFFLKHNHNPKFTKIYEDIKIDRNKHILNRSICYHPSPLHKSIREDDIDTFQSLLYKNNYGVNYEIEFSIYERAQTIDPNLSLIQVAATYGSIKIFKFLWMQTDIKLPKNLLLYAFFGCNNEIIHLCEEKLPDKDAVLQTIYLNRLDFLDYYIENFSNQFEEKNKEIKKILEKYKSLNEDNENSYDELNSEQLDAAIDFYTIPVIKSSLCKICFIIKNIEMNNDLFEILDKELIVASLPHFDLFKFLYTQRNDSSVDEYSAYYYCVKKSILSLAFDSFKFLLNELKGKINFFTVFKQSIDYSRLVITNYLLDLQIEELENDSENAPIYSSIYDSISLDQLLIQIQNFDEEIIVKMIKLYDFFINEDDVEHVVKFLSKSASSKMIINLLKQIMKYLDQSIVIQFHTAFEYRDKTVASFIKQFYLD